MIDKNKFSKEEKEKLKKRIPKGMYCEEYIDGELIRCPFWDMDSDRPYQSNGYCHFLEKGDWDLIQKTIDSASIKQTHPVEKEYTSEEIKELYEEYGNIGFALLWDGCKECNENTDDDYE